MLEIIVIVIGCVFVAILFIGMLIALFAEY